MPSVIAGSNITGDRSEIGGYAVLRARGMVCGNLKSSNLSVSGEGRPGLTPASRLLYPEPADDVRAVVEMLRELPLGSFNEDPQDPSLRRLAARLSAIVDARETDASEQPDGFQGLTIRRRAVLGESATALVGIALFLGLKQYAAAKTPKPPIPPQ